MWSMLGHEALVTGATGIVGSTLVRALLRGSIHSCGGSAQRALACRPWHRPLKRRPRSVEPARRGQRPLGDISCRRRFLLLGGERGRTTGSRGARNTQRAGGGAGARVRRVVVTSSSVVLGSTATRRVLDEANATDEPEPSEYTRAKVGQETAAFRAGEELGVVASRSARPWSWVVSTTG